MKSGTKKEMRVHPKELYPSADEVTSSTFARRMFSETSIAVQHRTFPWVPVPIGEEALDIDDAIVVEEFGVPKDVILKYVQKERMDEDSLRSLPFALMFIVTFLMCVLNHDHADVIGDIEDAIETDLRENAEFGFVDPGDVAHKRFHDVYTYGDVYSWLRIGLLPLLFKKYHIWSEFHPDEITDPYIDNFSERPQQSPEHNVGAPQWPVRLVPEERKPYVFQYNRLIGGMELTQLRAETKACDNFEVASMLKASCSPTEEFLALNLHVEPEKFDIREANIQVDPKETTLFLVGEDLGKAQMRLRQKELSDWLDNSTIMVAANFMVYNAHFDTLTMSNSMFFFSRSGKIWKQQIQTTFLFSQYDQVSDIIWDAIFAAMGLKVLLSEMYEIISLCRRYRKSSEPLMKIVKEYFNFWNIVDLISLACGIVMIILWIVHYHDLFYLKEELKKVIAAEEEVRSIFDEMRYEVLVRSLYVTYRSTRHFYVYFRLLASLFSLVALMRLFKSFNAQPKLAIVIRTMVRASNDLLHFSVVFVATFVSFTLLAHALFGREILKFRTFWRCFSTCFEVMLGEFDVSEMKGSGRAMATFWFISFQVIMTLFMSNMLIAIILDVYSEVKSQSQVFSEVQDLPTHAFRLWRRWRKNRSGRRVSWCQIERDLIIKRRGSSYQSCLDALDDHPEAEIDKDSVILTVDDFCNIVEGLERKQATRLMVRTLRNFRHEHGQPVDPSDTLRAVNRLQKTMLEVHKNRNQSPSPQLACSSLIKATEPASPSIGPKVSEAEHEMGASPTQKLLEKLDKRLELLDISITKHDHEAQGFKHNDATHEAQPAGQSISYIQAKLCDALHQRGLDELCPALVDNGVVSCELLRELDNNDIASLTAGLPLSKKLALKAFVRSLQAPGEGQVAKHTQASEQEWTPDRQLFVPLSRDFVEAERTNLPVRTNPLGYEQCATRELLEKMDKRLELLERKQNDGMFNMHRMLEKIGTRIEHQSKLLLCSTYMMSTEKTTQSEKKEKTARSRSHSCSRSRSQSRSRSRSQAYPDESSNVAGA